MKYSLVKARQPAHVLIIGEPKTGKTLLTTSLVYKGYKILYLSIDNGLMTVFDKVSPALLESNFEFIKLPDTTDFPVAYQTIYELLRGKPIHICDNHGQANCAACKKVPTSTWTDICLNDLGLDWVIVMDHATQLTKSAMNYYMQKQKLDPEEYKFEWDDWRKLGVMMDRIFLPIQQSKNNWVVLAHVAEVEMEDGKKKLTAAIGTGNYARNSGGFFDHVVYCEVANLKHAIGSSTTFRVTAITGSRSDIAIEKMLDKDGRASLVPFFDGTIQKENKHYAQSAADAILTTNGAGKREETPVHSNNGSDPVLLTLPESNGVAKLEHVDAVVIPVGGSKDIAAGVVTGMHAPAVALTSAPAVVVTTLTAEDTNARAKALLDKFRKK